ncbi:MAG: phosphatidate cytidylyltransferase [Anaerolineales bacterium]|nr:phosphatidate cytidylyltransferase [Anaerolineales bacterium]
MKSMLDKRIVTSLVMAAVGLPAIIVGGYLHILVVGVILGFATWEFAQLFIANSIRPSKRILVVGVVVVYLTRSLFPGYASQVLTFSILVIMLVYLILFERGFGQAPLEFVVTVCGMVYLGWIGAYMIDLRFLPDGVWWFFLVFGSIWAADIGAYFIGKGLGKHQFFPRSSPKKTWEGYIGGICTSLAAGVSLVLIWSRVGGIHLPVWAAILVSLVISVLAPFGDLGISMFKRLGEKKDSGSFLPGHGGFLDRIDTWLWGAVLGFYLVTWVIL